MLSVTHNIDQFRMAWLHLTRDDMPKITAAALNKTAYDGLDLIKADMRESFNAPTRWTLNAFMVWRADARTLAAEIKPRPSVGSRHYLKVQSAGGARPRTGIEGALISRLKYGGNIAAVTPARGAKLDGSGNWSKSQRKQVFSGVKAPRDAVQNTSTVSKKLSRNKKRAQFFVPKPGSKLSPGVYQRDGKTLTKVLNFTDTMPRYRKRVDFKKTVEAKAGKLFEGHLARRLANALR